MIYTVVDGKIVPYVSESGKRYHYRSQAQKHHNTLHAKQHNKYYKKFYNTYRWHKLSKNYRRQHPLCEMCWRKYKAGKIPLEKVNIATAVDHIVKLKDDWSRRFDPSNLQSICARCHQAKDGNSIENVYNRRQIND